MNRYLQQKLSMSSTEVPVFKLHIFFSVIQGIITGVFALNEYVLIMDMQSSDYQMSVLLQFSALVFLFSIFVNEQLKRVSNKKKMLRILAVVSYMPLLLTLFFPQRQEAYGLHRGLIYLFLAIFFLFYLNTIIVLPTINQMLKGAYRHANFGRLYSYASMLNKIIIMLSTLGFGVLLDYDNYSFTKIYPLMGLLGFISIWYLSQIPYATQSKPKAPLLQAVKDALKDTIGILRSNKPFLHFELGFMFYGLAWMMTTALIPLYFKEVFGMNHASYGFYKNGYNLLAILLLPFFGRLIGRIDPRTFGIYTFGSLWFFVVFLALARYFPFAVEIAEISIYPVLVLSYAFYGLFASTMALLWFIGSAYFCREEEAAQYQSIHLTLTGLRSLFSFQLGIVLYEHYGYPFTFSAAAVSLLLAVGIMYYSKRKEPMTIVKA